MRELPDTGFLGYTEVLRRSLEQSRAECRNHWPNCVGIMDAANNAVLACIGSILSRPDREYDIERVMDKFKRATIHSAVVQGIHAIEHCIANGIYARAAALVRMEIEAVGALVEIRQGRRKDGKTPNIFPLRHLGHTYGQLSGIAHLSTHDLLAHVVNEEIGNVDHRLNQDFARHLFGSHLCALAAFTLDLADFRPASSQKGLCATEEEYLSSVFRVLTELRFMVVKGT